MTTAPPATVDEYLAGVPDDARTALERLRGIIRAAAPQATETISYLPQELVTKLVRARIAENEARAARG